jgi:hypothetical protein
MTLHATFNMTAQVYRFKLSDFLVEEITRFAKIHQRDDRPTYKEAWEAWCDDNSRAIYAETERLEALGYEGSVIDKMYKAGRYYFRGKDVNAKQEPQTRRVYIQMDRAIINSMDAQIARQMATPDFTPAVGFESFCKEEGTVISKEARRLLGAGLPPADVALKIKKTYKNRYFLLSRASPDS